MTVPDTSSLSIDGDDDQSERNVIPLPGLAQDAAIVRALRAGHVTGTAGLFDSHHQHVRRVLVRVLGPDPELSDLVQEVFLAAIGGIDRLDRPEALRGWLSSIAVFTARGRLRRRRRWRFLQFFSPEDLPDVADERGPHLEVGEALRATYRVLDRLPVEERVVFALRFIEGMEVAEVANASGVSLSTAKRRLGKASARFATLAKAEPALSDWLNGDAKWWL
ncbi:MAG TPA: sigma-70 family RNA polymerase sigma factor [Polyangiaceae bacterium]|nr:sigma-70 family RNA polymerase sigma factor [Polyangiaceae bacterium]